MIEIIKKNNFPSDPVKAFHKSKALAKPSQENKAVQETDDFDNDYDYLLGMPLWSLTYERQKKLRELRDKKKDEMDALKKRTVYELWLDDLESLLKVMDKVDELEIKNKIEAKKKTNTQKIKTPVRSKEIDCFTVPEGKKIQTIARIDCDDLLPENGEDPFDEPVNRKLFAENANIEKPAKRVRKAPTKKDPKSKKEKESKPKNTTKEKEIRPKKRTLAPKSNDEPKVKKTKKVKDVFENR
ncbi:hypothetical protein MXB_4249 [Myxobolus squamalis]|nr:hypothetical protein MXB_4249 [Myxobolus squamalis]